MQKVIEQIRVKEKKRVIEGNIEKQREKKGRNNIKKAI